MDKYYEYSVINDVDYFIVDLSPVLFPIIQACILLEWDFLKLSILFTTHHCRIYLLVIKPHDFTLSSSTAIMIFEVLVGSVSYELEKSGPIFYSILFYFYFPQLS